MKQSRFVIVIAVLALSACGNKSEQEPTAIPVSPPLTEQKTTAMPDSPIATPAKDKISEISSPASATVTPITPEKTALEPAFSKPASPAKAEIPVTANNSKNSGAQSHEEGLALANKSGCLACHKIETKLVGPAWRDVSKRYKGDPDAKAHLIAKIKAGGKGNWTDVTGGIAMPPYSPRVSDENIEKLVTFVLSQ